MFDKRVIILMLGLTACSSSELTYCERRIEPFVDEIVLSSHFNIVDAITISSTINLDYIDAKEETIEDYIKSNQKVIDKYSNIELFNNYIVKTQRYILDEMNRDEIEKYVTKTTCDNCYVDYRKTIQYLTYQGFYCGNQ